MIHAAAVLLFVAGVTAGAAADPAGDVDPFIGTDAHGHTYPGATLPFGMVQLSPDTRLEGWDGCSGYHYSDDVVYGFSHTHLSGTGIPDYGDILFMPLTGEPRLNNGYGGNPEMVARHIPEMAEAEYFGHPGNTGDAVKWGEALGAEARDMGAYQGHGSVAHPQRILITWALMMQGAFQVNAEGRRFSNEHGGYSEQSVAVLGQPGRVAWNVYDRRLHELGMTFEDYRQAEAAGAVRSADSIETLAELAGLPAGALAATMSETGGFARGEAADPFGRDFTAKPALEPPYHAVKVTGALFHTQGGLVIDRNARVVRENGGALPNLFAGGGAARGLSGPSRWGYLSGNGLLTAVTLGRIAGREAARLVSRRS